MTVYLEEAECGRPGGAIESTKAHEVFCLQVTLVVRTGGEVEGGGAGDLVPRAASTGLYIGHVS